MFRKPGNGIIRVALFPLLLMFWQHIFGTDIPLIGPACARYFSPPLPTATVENGAVDDGCAVCHRVASGRNQ